MRYPRAAREVDCCASEISISPRSSTRPQDAGRDVESLPWIERVVEEWFLAYWIREITESSDGTLSPHTLLALAFLVNESHGSRNSEPD